MNGALEFKKFIQSFLKDFDLLNIENCFDFLIDNGNASPLSVCKQNDLLVIKKYLSSSAKDVVELEMQFKIKKAGSSIELWPLSFNSLDGKSLNAITIFKEKVFTNTQIQNELIEIANVWGKALSAQKFSRSLNSQA